MLESDKAENFASLLGGTETAGLAICGFSSTTATGLSISAFAVF